jgi:adenylate kinase
MRVLMIASPGAGKGTQGALIAAHFGIPRISTGELLRDHVARRTGLGQAVQGYLNRGELVPDQVVLDMLREAMVAAKAAGGGYVLDGIPQDMRQARAASLTGVGCCRLAAQNEFSVAPVSRRECRRPTADPVVRISRVEFAEDRG